VQEEELLKLQEQQNLQSLQSRIISSADKGLLLSTDMESISLMVGSVSDLTLYKNILKRFIELNQDSKISLVNAAAHVYKYYQLCHLLDAPDWALELLDDENVKQINPMSSTLACYSHLLVMNLLFKSKQYSDVVTIYEEMDLSQYEKSYETHSILTLTMLALIKSDKTVAFEKATMFLESYLNVKNPIELLSHGMGRLTYIYAWLACLDGNYLTAYEIVHVESKDMKRSLKTNLKMFTLLKMDKTIDAIFVLEDVIEIYDGPERLSHRKPKFCKEVIQLLVQAVNKSQDKEVISRLKSIFSKLDYVAEITGESIEDLLFLPVDNVGSVQRKRVTELDALKRRYKPKPQPNQLY